MKTLKILFSKNIVSSNQFANLNILNMKTVYLQRKSKKSATKNSQYKILLLKLNFLILNKQIKGQNELFIREFSNSFHSRCVLNGKRWRCHDKN